MFHLYGFTTQNTLKTLYVLEEVGIDYEFHLVNLGAGEQRSDDFRRMNPVSKVPVLAHDDEYLFESGAICRYVANVSESPLYPADPLQRARVDQWMDFMSCHLGRWMTKMYFEKMIKPKFDLGPLDEEGIAEALDFARQQLGVIDNHLDGTDWLANDRLSIADIFAYAYIEQYRDIDLSLDDYPNVAAWVARLDARPGIAKGRARVQR